MRYLFFSFLFFFFSFLFFSFFSFLFFSFLFFSLLCFALLCFSFFSFFLSFILLRFGPHFSVLPNYFLILCWKLKKKRCTDQYGKSDLRKVMHASCRDNHLPPLFFPGLSREGQPDHPIRLVDEGNYHVIVVTECSGVQHPMISMLFIP